MSAAAMCYAAVLACVLLTACGSSDDDSSSSSGSDGGSKAHAKQAGATGSDGGNASACNARDCWCEMSCANIASVACPDDQPQADCEKQCKMPMATTCAAQDLALVKCQATRPKSAFSCDLDQHIYSVKGCETEQNDVTNCLFNM